MSLRARPVRFRGFGRGRLSWPGRKGRERRFGAGDDYEGPLDLVPGAVAAYSMRAMEEGSTADAVTIRRDSDDVTQTFALTGNAVDVAAVTAFLGGSAGLATSWKDQSGNGFHAVQATEGLQPTWAPSLLNSKPGLNYPDTLNLLVTAGNVPFTGEITAFVVARLTTPGSKSMFGMNGGAGADWIDFMTTGGGTVQFWMFDQANGIQSLGNDDVSAQLAQYFLADAVMSPDIQEIMLNGVVLDTANSATPLDDFAGRLAIGDDDTGPSNEWIGDLIEVIIYAAELTSGQRDLVRANIATYYEITLP